jgi:TolB protein
MKRAVEVGPDTRYGLGVFSIGARCGRAWGHYGGILDYATTAFASESGERVGVISIYGRPPFLQADLGILVCPNYRLAKSAATSKIAFSTGRDVRAVNADGSRQRRLAPGTDPAWSPDGQSIAFVTGRHLYAMNADGSRRRRLVTGGDPAWSRDGRKIAFFRSGGVYVMNADGSRQRKLAHGSSPAWSPDGRTISFLRRGDIYVMDAGGGGQRNLTRDAAPDTDPAWSPDGRRIAFARKIAFPGGVGGSFEIFVMNADGSGQRRLTRDAARDDAPDWSPDGRRIVFERGVGAGGGGHEAGWFVIAVVSADGSGQPKELSRGEPLVDQGAPRAARPLWSPDGRMIAYLSWRHGNYDVYVMNADGSGLTNVTRSKASESSFAWSPVRSK